MPDAKPVEVLLTSIGLSAEDIAAVNAVKEGETFDAKPLTDKVRANYNAQLQNDPAFYTDLTLEKLPVEVKKKVESAQYGRAANIVRQKFLKSLGMTDADYADLPEESQKELESFIPAMAEKYAKSKAGDKKLQEDLIAARKELEKSQGLEETLKTKFQTESDQKIAAVIFNANLVSELTAIPGLKVKASTLAREASEVLRSKFAFEKVGDFGIELRNKENPQLKALKNGSSQEITLRDALLEIATAEGWVEKETKPNPTTGAGVVTVTPVNGELKTVAPHVAGKVAAKIASEAK